MPGPIDLMYTTIGGVIGAGLTQYVTHLRDRRAARALVVERLADVEETFTALRLALPEDGHPPTESQVARKLAALEASCLVAGVPQPVLRCYTVVCQYYEDAHHISRGTIFVTGRMAEMVNDNLVKLRENPNKDNIAASLKRMSEGIKEIRDKVKVADDPAFLLHDEALQELSRALWYPLVLQFRRRRLRDLQQRAEQLEKAGRGLAASLRSVESFYGQVSRSGNSLKAAEGTTPGDAKAVTEQK